MKKPVILLGNGARGNPNIISSLEGLNIPVLTTWMGMDLIPEDSPVFCGRPGILGQRAANIIQQKADLLLVLGARLDTGQVAYNYDNFAPRADKQIIDVDLAELSKFNVKDDSKWSFYNKNINVMKSITNEDTDIEWLSWCKYMYNYFRPELDSIETPKGYVDPYKFMSYLSDLCTENDILAPGSSGQTAEIFMQTFKVKRGQRVTCVSTIGAMGADIPMAIGACIASGKKRTICVTGDGGFMLNIQELEVIRRLNLPIKFFVFNNQGYGSIRTMQDTRFGRRVGCDKDSGFTLPELFSVVDSYGIGYDDCYRWEKNGFHNFNNDAPMVYELRIDPNFRQYPKVMAPNLQIDPMEDMTPKLDPEALKKIMEWGND